MAHTTKAIVTITPPVTAGTSLLLSTATTTSISAASLTNLSLSSPNNMNNSTIQGSLSGASTPMIPTAASKHCTFALKPITIPPPPNKVSFLSTAKFHSNSVKSPTIATTPSTTIAAAAISSIITAASSPSSTMAVGGLEEENETATTVSLMNSHHHPKLEMRPSVTSQITTIEDVDEICKLPLENDDDIDGIHHYSSPSDSSLSSSAAVFTRDNIITP